MRFTRPPVASRLPDRVPAHFPARVCLCYTTPIVKPAIDSIPRTRGRALAALILPALLLAAHVARGSSLSAFSNGDFETISSHGKMGEFGEAGRGFGVNGGGGVRIAGFKTHSFRLKTRPGLKLEKGQRYVFSLDTCAKGKVIEQIAMEVYSKENGRYLQGYWGRVRAYTCFVGPFLPADGKPFMPLGFYSDLAYTDRHSEGEVEQLLAELEAAGFNFLIDYGTYTLKTRDRRDFFYGACQRHRIRVMPDDFAGLAHATNGIAECGARAKELAACRAALAWYAPQAFNWASTRTAKSETRIVALADGKGTYRILLVGLGRDNEATLKLPPALSRLRSRCGLTKGTGVDRTFVGREFSCDILE